MEIILRDVLGGHQVDEHLQALLSLMFPMHSSFFDDQIVNHFKHKYCYVAKNYGVSSVALDPRIKISVRVSVNFSFRVRLMSSEFGVRNLEFGIQS